MASIQRIHPFLWFDNRAEEAARFYVEVFGGDSAVTNVLRIPVGPAAGNVLVDFRLDGVPFTAVDGGPVFTFTPAISLVVACETQAEIDRYRERLSDGGRGDLCGWVHDRFGVSWQVLPAKLNEWAAAAPEPVMEAFMEMTKIDLERLRRLAGAD